MPIRRLQALERPLDTVAVLAVVAGFFVATWPRAGRRHFPEMAAGARPFRGGDGAAGAFLWAGRLPVGPGPAPSRRHPGGHGARIWFLSNLAGYVPGNVWSYVGAVELAGARAWPGGPPWPSWPSPRSSRSGWRCSRAARAGRAEAPAGPAGCWARWWWPPGRCWRRCSGASSSSWPAPAGSTAGLTRRRPRWRGWWPATPSTGRSPAWPSPPWWPASILLPVRCAPGGRLHAAAYAAGFLALLTPAGLGVREEFSWSPWRSPGRPGPGRRPALQVWMMLVELAGAGVAHLVDRYRTPV